MVSQFRATVKPVVVEAPRELLHRAASYVIICEGMFHTFASFRIAMLVGGIIFIIIESWSICKEKAEKEESFDAS